MALKQVRLVDSIDKLLVKMVDERRKKGEHVNKQSIVAELITKRADEDERHD